MAQRLTEKARDALIVAAEMLAVFCVLVAVGLRFFMWSALIDGDQLTGDLRWWLARSAGTLAFVGLTIAHLLLAHYLAENGWETLVGFGWIALVLTVVLCGSTEMLLHAKGGDEEYAPFKVLDLGWFRSNMTLTFYSLVTTAGPELGAALLVRVRVLRRKAREQAADEAAINEALARMAQPVAQPVAQPAVELKQPVAQLDEPEAEPTRYDCPHGCGWYSMKSPFAVYGHLRTCINKPGALDAATQDDQG